MDVKDSLALVIRVMMQIQSNQARSDIKHIYLRGAEVLRLDIAQ
jgi:chorismate mutase